MLYDESVIDVRGLIYSLCRGGDMIREIAFEDYKAGMSCADIAKKHDLKPATVRQWAKRHWNNDVTKCDSVTSAKVTPEDIPQTVENLLAEAVEGNTELSPRARDFCRFFTSNKNATQAYLKAYNCSYNTAKSEGYKLLSKPRIKEELRRLQEIRDAALGLSGNDIVELHMRIAFADVTDFVEFESKAVPVTVNGIPVCVQDADTGEEVPLHKNVNEVRLKSSDKIDGNLITEVSEGREGVKIKLADRQKSLAFLERYFWLNPLDKHKKDYDNRRIVVVEKQAEQSRDIDYELLRQIILTNTKGMFGDERPQRDLRELENQAICTVQPEPEDVPESG